MATLVPDEVILGLLKAQPAHGYELLDYFRSYAQLGRIWTMSTSQLYAVLKRLEREGAIVGREVAALNAPPRIEYEVTSQGNIRLDAWLFASKPSPSIHRIRVLFLSRIFIANLLKIPFKPIVDAQIASCEAQKILFEDKLRTKGTDIELLTIDFIIRQLNSAILWLKESNFEVEVHQKDKLLKGNGSESK